MGGFPRMFPLPWRRAFHSFRASQRDMSFTKQPARRPIGRSQMAERAIPHIAWEAFRPVVDFVDANIERRVRLEEK